MKSFRDYLTESIEKNIEYSEYLAEKLYSDISYSDDTKERIKEREEKIDELLKED